MNKTLARSEATSVFCALSFSKRLIPEAYRPVVLKYLRRPVVRWLDTILGTWTTESEPSCQPTVSVNSQLYYHCKEALPLKKSCSAALRNLCSVSVFVTGLNRRTPIIFLMVSPVPSSA